MNKKLFFLLILFAFVAQPAHAWFGWVQLLKDGVRDSYHVFKPEWSTGSTFENQYKKMRRGK